MAALSHTSEPCGQCVCTVLLLWLCLSMAGLPLASGVCCVCVGSYSYAIVGINLTEMAFSLLKSGALKPHFYNSVAGSPSLEHFHQLYCYLAYEFDKFWIEEEPASIMEFNLYRERFHEKVKMLLGEPDVSLSLKLTS